MHCYICDADSDTVSIDKGEITPCAECQSAIYECVLGYPKLNDAANDDDDYIEPIWDGEGVDYDGYAESVET